MYIHKEGYNTILLAYSIAIASIIVINIIWEGQTIFHYIYYGLLVILLLFIKFFFRSPSRKIIPNHSCVLSAADGKVVAIEKTIEQEYFKKEMVQISVFMSPLNIHLNRYPVQGRIDYVNYIPGKYLVAWLPKSSHENERNSVVITTENKKSILIRQIAGAVARRIVCYSKTNHKAEQGQEMGFIKFGSRVDVFVPVGAEVSLKNGDTVKAGETVIAKI